MRSVRNHAPPLRELAYGRLLDKDRFTGILDETVRRASTPCRWFGCDDCVTFRASARQRCDDCQTAMMREIVAEITTEDGR